MKRMFSTLLLTYFRSLAKLQIRKVKPTIIGITGSAGKTSTLNACESVLSAHYSLKVSHKANSESGIPLNILDLHPKTYSASEWLKLAALAPLQLLINWKRYDIYLVELGVDSPLPPKNMSYLLSIVQPDVGVFLNASATHAEPFDHLVTTTEPGERRQQLVHLIAAEKGKLITSLPSSGYAILNADDEAVIAFKKYTQATVVTFGTHTADVKIGSVQWNQDSTKFNYKYLDQSYILTISGYLLPRTYAATFGAALCVGLSQNMSFQASISALEKSFKLPPGRSSLIKGINNTLIIDSSYNASTQPMLDMLELLQHVAGKRKLALLGDMREIGTLSEHEHVRVAQLAARVCDKIYLVGDMMKQYALPVLKKAKVAVEWFPTAHEAGLTLQKQLKHADVLLVKGSQNTLLLESAVEMLMANPKEADKLLCRRGGYWEKQRRLLISPTNNFAK